MKIRVLVAFLLYLIGLAKIVDWFIFWHNNENLALTSNYILEESFTLKERDHNHVYYKYAGINIFYILKEKLPKDIVFLIIPFINKICKYYRLCLSEHICFIALVEMTLNSYNYYRDRYYNNDNLLDWEKSYYKPIKEGFIFNIDDIILKSKGYLK